MSVAYYHVYDFDLDTYICYDLISTIQHILTMRDTGKWDFTLATRNLEKLKELRLIDSDPSSTLSFWNMEYGNTGAIAISNQAFFKLYGVKFSIKNPEDRNDKILRDIQSS